MPVCKNCLDNLVKYEAEKNNGDHVRNLCKKSAFSIKFSDFNYTKEILLLGNTHPDVYSKDKLRASLFK